jgi:hypothetical protein
VNYEFTGQSPRFYPDIVGENGSLIAEPGDVVAFDNPPADGLWAETQLPVTAWQARTWPLKAEAPEAPAEEIPAAANTELTPSLPFGPAGLTSDVPETQES